MRLLLVIILFWTQFSSALQSCEDTPEVLGASGPNGAVTAYPFTYNVRLSCLLEPNYALQGLAGEYSSADGVTIPNYKGIIGFKLPDGNILYQFLYVIPAEQANTVYSLNPVLELIDLRTQTLVQIPLPEQPMNVVTPD